MQDCTLSLPLFLSLCVINWQPSWDLNKYTLNFLCFRMHSEFKLFLCNVLPSCKVGMINRVDSVIKLINLCIFLFIRDIQWLILSSIKVFWSTKDMNLS